MMKRYLLKIINRSALILLTVGLTMFQEPLFADDSSTGSWDTFELMPIRVINVKGDAAKFRALNWMDDGTTGGIKAMGFDSEAGEGGQVSFDGHAIPGDNDLGAGLKLIRGNGGYITMDYGNFRKYYDVYGGFYSNFTGTSSIRRLAADPKMDMGHFFFEIGSNSNILENVPGVSLSYERDTKEGIKSRLTWGTVTQGIQRKIAPSWEDVSETTDTIILKGNTDVAGVNLSGRQRVEFSGGRSFREDDSTTAFRSYAQEPQTKQLVSSLKADRWIVDDKTYMAFAYQFHHSRNDWLETIRNYDATGAITSSSNNRVADAQATRDSHSWVQHFVTNLTPNLNFVTKLKEEIVAQTGTGFADGYDPGGSDRAVESENKITRTGESLSLRYSGLPKTSLYTDWDFQQTRNWYSKDRVGSSHTEYLDSSPEMTGVMGVRYAFNRQFNMTSNFRRKSDHNTYNILSNNDAAITISRLRTYVNEWNNRLTWKPSKWLESSFRAQLLDNVYRVQSLDKTGFTGTTDWIKSQANSRIFTYNVVWQPLEEWMFDLGYSLNNFKVSTPASQTAVSGGGIPVFEANFHTWLVTTSYAPKDSLSFFTDFQYTRAKDFDSQAFAGIPYGVDNEHYDAGIGMKWSPKENITLAPHYAYYSYRANQSMDYGNYSAHAAWFDFNYDW
jgi:hypothetical protein